jgi:putative membrane protein
MKKIISYFQQLGSHDATRFLVIFYIVGTIGFLLPYTRNVFEALIPVSVLVNLFLLLLFHRPYEQKYIYAFLLIAVPTFLIEAVGTNTGVLFGEYAYGTSLGVKLFKTPLLIGVNWLVLVYGAVSIVRKVEIFRRFSVLSASLLMVFFDWVMEPVAMKTDMWQWAFNRVPFQNYLMWFVVSAFAVALFELMKIETTKTIAARIFVIQLIFFGILNLFLS